MSAKNELHIISGDDLRRFASALFQALEVAREAGLEDRVRPLVEVRLADLPLEAEEPRSSPPDA